MEVSVTACSAFAWLKPIQRTQRWGGSAVGCEVLEQRRLLSGGTLDPTFGTGGFVTREISLLGSTARAVVVQADGRIVAAGQTSNGGLALARFTVDGTLDPTFGINGIVTTNDVGSRFDAV